MSATSIDTTLHLTSCEAGLKDGGHIVIEGCSSSACELRDKVICNMCAYVLSKHNKGDVICLDRYCKQLDDSINSVDKAHLLGPIKTQEDMQAELRESGWVINDKKVTNMETLDVYDSLVANKSVDRFTSHAEKVLFPIYPPSQIDQVLEVVKDMRLCHGASFLADPSIDYNTIANVVVLLSTYVTFDRIKHVDYQDNMFMLVPANIVEFAYHSRIDSGYRLLERCLRHSFD